MPSRLAQHIDQEVRRTVDDLRLIAETVGRQDKPDQLRHLLYVVEAGGRLDLRQYVERTDPRSRLRLLNRHLVGTSPGETLAIFDRDLARDVQKSAAVADPNQPGRYV